MFRHLRPAEINRPQWDALIEAAPNGIIYALTWYLDSASPGWEALVKEEAGRYVAVLPLPVRRKLGFNYVQQPLLTQQLGLFYAPAAPPTASDWQHIGALLRRHFRFIVRYAFNTGNEEARDLGRLGPAFAPFAGAVATNYHLSLRPPYAALRAGYSANRRWRLNQARRRGLCLEPSTDIERLIALFRENTAGKMYGGVGEEAYRALRAVYAAASRAGLAALWQARPPGGEVGAMILLVRFRQQLIYLFSATNAAGKKAGAISLLLDAVVQAHAGQDLCLDFEAPADKDVVHFYRSFGPAPVPYGTIALNQLPWPVRQLRAARLALVRRLAPRPAAGPDSGAG
jgi:hypothetical protein